MRILQVVVGYHPARAEFGGIVETVEHLSNELVRRGHEVEVWTTALVGRGEPLVRGDVTAQRGGVTLRYWNTWHPKNLGYGFAFSPSFGRAIAAGASRFDVIHINGYRNYLAVTTMLAAMAARVPFLIQPHGTIPPVVHRVRLKRWFDRALGDRLLHRAAGLLAISRSEAALFGDHGIAPDEVEVVYNGIDTGMDEADLGDGGWFRDELGLDAEHVLLYLGRLHERKGIEHLVGAFERLAPTRDDVALAIIGADDGYRETLARRVADSPVSDRIRLVGPRYGQAKYRAFHSAALVVYPAVHEYFGLVPFEALLCGTPSVVSSGAGCAEVLERVDGGWSAPYGDPAALAGVIEKALGERTASRARWDARVATARQRILERFTWPAVTDHILGIYTRAAAGGR